jgi:hypothetical protein
VKRTRGGDGGWERTPDRRLHFLEDTNTVNIEAQLQLSEHTNTAKGRDMLTRTAIANGADSVQRQAATDANLVQSACNIIAITGAFHGHLLALNRAGVFGDDLINHPVALAFVSKLVSLCRMTDHREMAALLAIDKIEQGEAVEYEVLPL